MSTIQPIAETEDTVTLRRADYEQLLEVIGVLKDATLLDALLAQDGENPAEPPYDEEVEPLAAGA
ncbi:hypothetical protein [Methylobacterium sp. JK268]